MTVPPSVWIRYQLVGAYDDQQITLECHSEAYPKSINYWTRDKGDIIPHSGFLNAGIVTLVNPSVFSSLNQQLVVANDQEQG